MFNDRKKICRTKQKQCIHKVKSDKFTKMKASRNSFISLYYQMICDNFFQINLKRNSYHRLMKSQNSFEKNDFGKVGGS